MSPLQKNRPAAFFGFPLSGDQTICTCGPWNTDRRPDASSIQTQNGRRAEALSSLGTADLRAAITNGRGFLTKMRYNEVGLRYVLFLLFGINS